MRRHHVTKNIATSSLMVFQRHELKYFVPNNLAAVLIPEFLQYLEYDRFSSDGPYAIYSVYFDTIDWQAFYNKIDGNEHRRKFRIRSYIAHPQQDDNVFLEVKEKKSDVVFKRRTPIKFEDARMLISGKPIEKKSTVVDEWRYGILHDTIRPALLNSYNRLAFHSLQYPGLRITIDSNLRYTLTNKVDFSQPTHIGYWTQGKSVVEIKFDRYVPKFVVDIIRRYNLSMVPVSKYCDSIISHFQIY